MNYRKLFFNHFDNCPKMELVFDLNNIYMAAHMLQVILNLRRGSERELSAYKGHLLVWFYIVVMLPKGTDG